MKSKLFHMAAVALGLAVFLYAVPALAIGFGHQRGGTYDLALEFDGVGKHEVKHTVFGSRYHFRSTLKDIVFEVLSGTVDDLQSIQIGDVALLDLVAQRPRNGYAMGGPRHLYGFHRFDRFDHFAKHHPHEPHAPKAHGGPQAAIPEPSAAVVFGIGALFVSGAVRRRR